MLDGERTFTYTVWVCMGSRLIIKRSIPPTGGKKYMNRAQYLKIIEKEIHNINKKIDIKILQGEEYRKEAQAHKVLLRKVRQHSHQSFFSKLFRAIPQIAVF